MAKTIAQWQVEIKAAKIADAVLNAALTSVSAVAEWLLWTYVGASCAHTLDSLFDYFKEDVLALLIAMRPHKLQWYTLKAKAFQFGYSLPEDSDVYDVIDDAAMIVTEAKAEENVISSKIRIKTAKGISPALEPLSATELNSFKAYMARVKDAGVRIDCTSTVADTFRPTMKIFYDPLVLDADGKRLDGTNDTPVKDAVNAFLAALPFNGIFVTAELVVALRAVEGVRIPDIDEIKAHYAAMPDVVVDYEYKADAGYMVLDDAYFDAHVTYVAHGPIN